MSLGQATYQACVSHRGISTSVYIRATACWAGAHVFQLIQQAVYGPPVAEVWEVDCGGFMASIAHNVMKAVRSSGHGTGLVVDHAGRQQVGDGQCRV